MTMPTPEASAAAAARIDVLEGPEAIAAIVGRVAEHGGRLVADRAHAAAAFSPGW